MLLFSIFVLLLQCNSEQYCACGHPVTASLALIVSTMKHYSIAAPSTYGDFQHA